MGSVNHWTAQVESQRLNIDEVLEHVLQGEAYCHHILLLASGLEDDRRGFDYKGTLT